MAASNSAPQVSTVLNVAFTPAASRAARTSASEAVSHRYASWASEKPRRLARRQSARVMAARPPIAARVARSAVMRAIWSRNQGSTLVASYSRSTLIPRRRAASSWNGRSGVATDARATSSSSPRPSRAASPGSQLSPHRPCSRERSPFCSDSGNVRPIAIASPTDCMRVPSTSGAPGNFSNAHRGILVTT